MPEAKVSRRVSDYLRKIEIGIYHALALMLSITAVAALGSAGRMLSVGVACRLNGNRSAAGYQNEKGVPAETETPFRAFGVEERT